MRTGVEETVKEEGTLLQRTRALLAASSESKMSIAARADVPYFWVRTLAQGQTQNPNVNRVQKLYEALSGTKLL